MAKHIVSVSLGSATRDHKVNIQLLGEDVCIERRGTNGDVKQAMRLIAELDGHVDAFGLGGIDRYIYAGHRRYTLRDGERIARAAKLTPIVDGSGLKDTLERWVIPYLEGHGTALFPGKKVLMVAGVDRFGMAEALVDVGAEVHFADLLFILGIPYPLRTLKGLRRLAGAIAPVVVRLPARWIYPTGSRQHKIQPKHQRYYDWADIIAGDFILIKRFLPDSLEGKTILTNTVTMDDVHDLKSRGVATLITTTPDLGGRSFGTNVVEATLVALGGGNSSTPDPGLYMEILQSIGFQPRILRLNAEEPQPVSVQK